MSHLTRLGCALVLAAAATFAFAAAAHAQTGYGVTSNGATGTLFRFDVNNTGTATTVTTLPFVPEAIDFRPGTNVLYAIDVEADITQLYAIDIQTGNTTPVGDGFPSAVTEGEGQYSLVGATIGFDFNPRTLQADGSVRIRVVASNGTNLRLNSDTGQVAAVDTALAYAPSPDPNAGATPMVDAAAYTNSARSTAAAAGTTTLFVMDFGTDDLATQSPPNNGTLNTVGSFGASVNAVAGIGFDIVTDPASTDDGIGGDRAYAVLKRPDAPAGNENAYLLYDVNLSTGQLTGARLVGPGSGMDFTGGFAVLGDIVSTGGLVISEFRFRGPQSGESQNSAFNEFIELYNASGSDIIVSAADGSEGFSVAASVPNNRAEVRALASSRLFVIPNGTLIPARGHYLAVNANGFSLTDYPAGTGGVSFGDNTYTQDIGDAEGIAVFNTADTADYSTTTRLDAAGFASVAPPPAAKASGVKPSVSDPLFAEGAGIPRAVTVPNDHSFVRRMEGGPPRDTNDNAADFVLVSTNPQAFEGNAVAVLGAPGPESTLSPIQRNDRIKASLIDPGCVYTTDPTLACATTRNETPDVENNSTFGTLRIRRRWTNNTGAPVSRMRFRAVDITTFGSPNICNNCNQADLRVRSSNNESGLTVSGGGTAGTQGLTLELPAGGNNGGLNSSLSVSLETPIPDGESINLNFLLGVQGMGLYRFYVNVEVVRATETVEAGSSFSKAGGRSAKPARAKPVGTTRRGR